MTRKKCRTFHNSFWNRPRCFITTIVDIWESLLKFGNFSIELNDDTAGTFLFSLWLTSSHVLATFQLTSLLLCVVLSHSLNFSHLADDKLNNKFWRMHWKWLKTYIHEMMMFIKRECYMIYILHVRRVCAIVAIWSFVSSIKFENFSADKFFAEHVTNLRLFVGWQFDKLKSIHMCIAIWQWKVN